MRLLPILLATGCTVAVQPAPEPASAPQPASQPASWEEDIAAPRPRLPKRGFKGFRDPQPKVEPNGKDMCEPSSATLNKAAADVLTQTPSPAIAFVAWDRKSTPARWKAVADRFLLDSADFAALKRNGMRVFGNAVFDSYAEAYHEIYQSELPIYVSADSVLQAIFVSHARLLARIERNVFAPRLSGALQTMHAALPASEYPQDIAQDLDLYLSVARSLLAGNPVRAILGADPTPWLKRANDAAGIAKVSLFGRDRFVDFAAFRPRGHYVEEDLEDYFRGVMWLSRIELNLVTRGSRSSTQIVDLTPTPRETAVALALADLADRSGVLPALKRIDDAWGALSGPREDVPIDELARLRKSLGKIDLGAAARLAAAIGPRFERTIAFHVTPVASPLPVVTTLLGPRLTPDTLVFPELIAPKVRGRIEVTARDVGYVLGHDRARAHLPLAQYPELSAQLDRARSKLVLKDDLYSAWLRAIAALASKPAGVLPSYAQTEAHRDLMLGSAIVGYGQLRHNYVLIAGHGYLGSGCNIPDGWVEPVPEMYDALIAYSERAAAIFATLEANDTRTYFEGLSRTLRVLRAIVENELAGRPLSESERRFLGMVAEITPGGGSGGPPTYAGWYFDLFLDFGDALKSPAFAADYAWNDTAAMTIGAARPRIGVFVVDAGSKPRVVVGPVADGFEMQAPLAHRVTDEEMRKERPRTATAAWQESYSSQAAAVPNIRGCGQYDWGDGKQKPGFTLLVNGQGQITITTVDHHRRKLETKSITLNGKEKAIRFKRHEGVTGVLVRAGAFTGFSELVGEESCFGFGETPE